MASWELLFTYTQQKELYEWEYSSPIFDLSFSGKSISDYFLCKTIYVKLDIPNPEPNYFGYVRRNWIYNYCQLSEFNYETKGNSILSPRVQGQLINFYPQIIDAGFTFDYTDHVIYMPWLQRPGSGNIIGRTIGIRRLSKATKNRFFGRVNMYGDSEGNPTRYGTTEGGIGGKTDYDDRMDIEIYHWIGA